MRLYFLSSYIAHKIVKTDADPPRSRYQESSLRETSRGNLKRKQEEVGRAFRPQCFLAFEKRGKKRKIGWKHPDCRSKKVEIKEKKKKESRNFSKSSGE